VHFPQSFVLKDNIPNTMGVSTSSGVSKKMPSFIPRFKEPTSLMGVAKTMCQAPLFFAKTLAILNVPPITIGRSEFNSYIIIPHYYDNIFALQHPYIHNFYFDFQHT